MASSSYLARISQLLIDEGYRVLYPARRIFSVYYDHERFPEYWRGEEGVVPRKKLRVRWYHNQIGFLEKASFEVKITGVDGRLKYTAPVDCFESDLATEVIEMRRLIDSRQVLPRSLVSYVRRYFSDDSGRRFTVDHDITYRTVHSFNMTSLLLGTAARDDSLALELKAPYATSDLNFAETVPMTRIRFSKFSRSLEHLQMV
jgi:hypothetical protein